MPSTQHHETPVRNDPLHAFVHVPKTAGTSMRSILAAHYGPQDTWFYQGAARGYFPADGAILAPDKVNRQTRMKPLLNLLPDIIIAAGVRYAGRRAEPASVAMARARAVVGHVPASTYREQSVPRPINLYTVVRDPLERMVSHYRYVQQNRRLPEPLKGWMRGADPKQPFADFALSEPLRNVQTSYTGTDLSIYEQVGTTEQLDGFLRRVGVLAVTAAAPRLRVGAQPFTQEVVVHDPGFRRDFEAFHADDYAFHAAAQDA